MIDPQDLADLEGVFRAIDHAVGDGLYRGFLKPEAALEKVSRHTLSGLRIVRAARARAERAEREAPAR